MPAELTVLALSVLLAVVQLVLFAVPANREIGTEWTLGPRDTPMPDSVSPTTLRLKRAFDNHIEGLVLFAAAVLVVVGSGRGTETTAALAWAYLAARVIYLPLYWAGVPFWRSMVWSVGLLATALIVIMALIGA